MAAPASTSTSTATSSRPWTPATTRHSVVFLPLLLLLTTAVTPAAGWGFSLSQVLREPPPGGGSNKFTAGLALSADGSTLLAGSPARQTLGMTDRGDAWVYALNASAAWAVAAPITGASTALRAYGAAIATSADGRVVAIGAPNSASQYGRVAVWTRTSSPTGSGYTQSIELGASLAQFGDFFGRALALSAAGDVLAIGSPQRSNSPGAVSVCYADPAAGWSSPTCVSPLVPPRVTSTFNLFGCALSLDAAGTTLLVGASNYNSSRGGAYVFTRANASVTTWDTGVLLQPPGGLPLNGNFGTSVAICPDASCAVVGSPVGGYVRGAVYTWDRSPVSRSSWEFNSLLRPANSLEGDAFGKSVVLTLGGSTLMAAAGVWTVSTWNRTGAGAPWLPARDATMSVPQAMNIDFGASLAVDAAATTVAVGAPGNVPSNVINGTLYIFSRPPPATPTPTPTATGSATPSETGTPSGTPSGTAMATATGTGTPTPSPSGSGTGSPTGSQTDSATPTLSPGGSSSSTASTTPTGSASPSVGGSPTATPTGSASGTASPGASPTATPTGSPTGTPTLPPGASPSSTPTGTASPSATATVGGGGAPPQAAAGGLSPGGAAALSIFIIAGVAFAGGLWWFPGFRAAVAASGAQAAAVVTGGRMGGDGAAAGARRPITTRPTAVPPRGAQRSGRMVVRPGVASMLAAAGVAPASPPGSPARGAGATATGPTTLARVASVGGAANGGRGVAVAVTLPGGGGGRSSGASV